MSGMWRQRQRREHLLACLAPTARGLVVNRSPRPCPAVHSGLASACVPTDDGAATRPADPAVPWKAARSTGSVFLPAASESTPRLADHVSACGARPPGSSRGDRPDIRFPTLPSGSQNTVSILSLGSPRALVLVVWNRSPARCSLRVPRSSPPVLLFRYPASRPLVVARVSRIL